MELSFLTFGLLLSFFFNLCFSSFTRSVKHVSALLKLKTNLSRSDRKTVKDTLAAILAENVSDGTRGFFSTFEVKWAVSDRFSSPRVSRLKVGWESGCTVSCVIVSACGVWVCMMGFKVVLLNLSCNKQMILSPFLLLRMLRRLEGDCTTALCWNNLVRLTAK